MKIFRLIIWVMLSLGLFSLLMHWPGAGLTCYLGVLLQLVHAIIYIAKSKKDSIALSFFYCSFACLNFCLFTILMPSWPYAISISFLLVGIVFAILHIAFYFYKKHNFGIKQILLGVYVLCLLLIPNHAIFYAIKLSYERPKFCNSDSWDWYSWLQYRQGKYDKALEANEKALQHFTNASQSVMKTFKENYKEILYDHRFKIENRTWDRFE